MPSPLRFDAWMQRALYDPNRGYYSRQIETVGGRGDFTTAPMLSDALARAIAKWAVKSLKEEGIHKLVEIGPGNGTLALAVWKALPWNLRRKCQLHLVEVSAPLRKQQQELLGKKASWHSSPQEALQACKGEAIIYSNELVDAFPCRRFERSRDGWMEIAVGDEELLLPVDPLPHSSIFERVFDKGDRIEVHESYREWLESWLPHWKAGRMLTIDYGAEAKDLYQRQPQGSMRAYLLQQRLTGPAIYENMGRQDLTADVNFTDLVQWSRPWLSEAKLQTLGQFLADTETDQRLLDPDGAGGAFKALEQKII